MTTDERSLCWAEFARATRERGHPFRQPVVMSVEGRRMLRFHIDRRSPKFVQWSNQPVVGAVFYDGPGKWQIRLKGVALLHYEDDVARAAWETNHPMGKRTYLTTAAPGEEVDWDVASLYPPGMERRRPTDEESEEGYRNFAVMLVDVVELDSLHLAGEGHRRFHIIDEVHKVRRLAP
jgi:pyridoxamine 5'-phosphate oxidase